MAAIRDTFPLSSHRASLAQYLRQIVFPTGSVAGTIIRERLGPRYIGDPLRPALVLWACDVAGGNVRDSLPVGAAFEFFGRFLLLHAELTEESTAALRRWGLGQSLNAGDAFYALAFRTLADDVLNPPQRLETARLVAQAVLEAIDECDDARRNAVLTAAALRAGAVIAASPQRVACAFEDAGRLLIEAPASAASPLRSHLSREHLAEFEKVACYVARRAA